MHILCIACNCSLQVGQFWSYGSKANEAQVPLIKKYICYETQLVNAYHLCENSEKLNNESGAIGL